MFIRNPFNWQLRFSTIPSEFRECLTYEEQIMWLYYHIKSITETSGNVNYEALENKPSINGVLLLGNKTLDELNIQSKLYAGDGITINGNVISATGGGTGGTTNYEELSNKPSINGVTLIGDKTFEDLGLNLPTKKVYKDITTDSNVEIADNVLFDLTSTNVGSNIPNWESASDTKTFCFKASVFSSLTFKVYGRCSNVMWFVTNGNPFFSIGSKILEEKSATNLNYSGDFVRLTVPTIGSGSYYITFQFTNVSTNAPRVEYESEEVDLDVIQKLSTDIILKDNENPQLEQGLYYTGEHAIFYNSVSEANLVFGFNDIIYYDISSNNVAISDAFKTYTRDFSANEWSIAQNTDIENELTDSRGKIPTSHAVYEAIQNISPTPTGDVFYTELNQPITLNADGTTNPTLTTGYYYLGDYTVSYYDINNTLQTSNAFKTSILYYDADSKQLKRTSVNSKFANQFECRLQYISSFWNLVLDDSSKYVKNNTNSLSFLSNSIPTTGDDNNVPNINAVRNYAVAKNNIENYSTTEQRVGTWLNGKPLYQKTISGTVPTTGTAGTYVTQDISYNVQNIEFVFDYAKFIVSQDESEIIPIPYFTNSNYQVKCVLFKNSVNLVNGIPTYNGYNFYLTIRYTKTTD